jgi:hypothetical protein
MIALQQLAAEIARLLAEAKEQNKTALQEAVRILTKK